MFETGITFKFDDSVLKKFKINKVDKIDDHEELWAFCKSDSNYDIEERRFLISTYGRVYDYDKKSIIEPTNSGIKSKNGYMYKVIQLINKAGYKKKVFLHRVVISTFYDQDPERPIVNHKDGCPEHNYLWNLEWCTTTENYWHAVREGLVKQQQGEERSNSIWTTSDVHLVCKMMEEGHKPKYIYTMLCELLKDDKVQYERVRSLYKHIKHKTHWTHIAKLYNIKYDKYDYAKEKGSLESVNKKLTENNQETSGELKPL